MEYTILEDDDATSMERLVNQHLRNGWELQGGISTCVLHDYNSHTAEEVEVTWYTQAMVKRP